MTRAERGAVGGGVEPVLRVEHLGKAFGRARVLHDLSFEVARGEVLALLGANGAGKTTTLACILGIVPFEGTVTVGGVSVRREGKRARHQIGYVPQTPALREGDTCREALRFLAELKGAAAARADELLARVDLAAQRDQRIGSLSGGMRQRLALAAALLADPPVLLLDEPTTSLDAAGRREFYALVRQLRGEGRTIVLSTHAVDQLDTLADRALILHEGRVAFDGTVAELGARSQRRRYVVSVNGTAAAFRQALRDAGIDASHVREDGLRWEDILTEAAGGGHEQPAEGAR